MVTWGNVSNACPSGARIVLTVVGIVGPVTGAVSTVVITVIDVRAKAADANKKSEAGYGTLAPAVKELQELLAEGQEWADETDAELRALEAREAEHEKRLIRLEAYIDILSKRRNLPEAPPKPFKIPKMISELPFHKGKKHTSKKPARPIPSNVKKAADYQQQRVQMQCPPGDPLCGATKCETPRRPRLHYPRQADRMRRLTSHREPRGPCREAQR